MMKKIFREMPIWARKIILAVAITVVGILLFGVFSSAYFYFEMLYGEILARFACAGLLFSAALIAAFEARE